MSTYKCNGMTIVLLRGNIVDAQVDAVVNAANSALAGGGGVDGAIHRAAGPTIMEECRKIGGCLTGRAVVTSAGRLNAKYIFHAVGPIYEYHREAAQLLADTYESCLDLAEQYKIISIAFPAISTGVYGYPLKEATSIALQTVIDHSKKPGSLQRVMFVLFSNDAYSIYEQTLIRLLEM